MLQLTELLDMSGTHGQAGQLLLCLHSKQLCFLKTVGLQSTIQCFLVLCVVCGLCVCVCLVCCCLDLVLFCFFSLLALPFLTDVFVKIYGQSLRTPTAVLCKPSKGEARRIYTVFPAKSELFAAADFIVFLFSFLALF